jgi:hypothetical protein
MVLSCIYCFRRFGLPFLLLARSAYVEIVVHLPLLQGSWVVLFGTSTLAGIFLAGL